MKLLNVFLWFEMDSFYMKFLYNLSLYGQLSEFPYNTVWLFPYWDTHKSLFPVLISNDFSTAISYFFPLRSMARNLILFLLSRDLTPPTPCKKSKKKKDRAFFSDIMKNRFSSSQFLWMTAFRISLPRVTSRCRHTSWCGRRRVRLFELHIKTSRLLSGSNCILELFLNCIYLLVIFLFFPR